MFPLQLNSLADDNFRSIFHQPADKAEVDPEDGDEDEQAPKKAAPRATKRPRAKASGSEAGASGETSARRLRPYLPYASTPRRQSVNA
jgi:hypothetical protein